MAEQTAVHIKEPDFKINDGTKPKQILLAQRLAESFGAAGRKQVDRSSLSPHPAHLTGRSPHKRKAVIRAVHPCGIFMDFNAGHGTHAHPQHFGAVMER